MIMTFFSIPPELEEGFGAYLCSPADLEASYARCRSLKLPAGLTKPQEILPGAALASLPVTHSLLLTASEQVIALIRSAGPQKNHLCILCDPDLAALELFAAPEVLAIAEETGIMPGTVFTEESCGTNALALAHRYNRLVVVRGEQHYCRLFKGWWCVAGPIKGPEEKNLGYLDISTHAEKEPLLGAAFLNALVALIEREFLCMENCQARNGFGLLPPPRLLPEIAGMLSIRERDVLKLLLDWLSDEEIARRLYLSITTVKKHRWNIYKKLGVGNLRELLAKLSR